MEGLAELFEYIVLFEVYTLQGAKITSDCNSIIFVNRSAHPLTINNRFIIPPNNITPPLYGNVFEIDRSQYTVQFDPADLAAGTQNLQVMRKFYKNPEKVAAYLKALIHGK